MLGAIQNIDGNDNKIHSSDMSTILEDKVNNSEESFFMEYKDVSDNSLDSSKLEVKQVKNSELASEIERLKASIEKKNQKIAKFKEESSEKDKKIENLHKQLELKVKNIEEERLANILDMKYKEEEINDLKTLLHMERERMMQSLRIDTPKQKIIDMEDRLQELTLNRQQLFEDIVTLKKCIDQRDEKIDKLTVRNERLERQANFQGYKTFQVNQNPASEVNVLNQKIRKPIKGGGGDIWNFQKNNQNIYNIETPDLKKNQVKLQKYRNSHSGGGGIQAMFSNVFGGFLG